MDTIRFFLLFCFKKIFFSPFLRMSDTFTFFIARLLPLLFLCKTKRGNITVRKRRSFTTYKFLHFYNFTSLGNIFFYFLFVWVSPLYFFVLSVLHNLRALSYPRKIAQIMEMYQAEVGRNSDFRRFSPPISENKF